MKYRIFIIVFIVILSGCQKNTNIPQPIDKKDNHLNIIVGAFGDKNQKDVRNGDTIEFNESYKNQYINIPIFIEYTPGISFEPNAVEIQVSSRDWVVQKVARKQKDTLQIYINTENSKQTFGEITIQDVLDRNQNELIESPIKFELKIQKYK